MKVDNAKIVSFLNLSWNLNNLHAKTLLWTNQKYPMYRFQ